MTMCCELSDWLWSIFGNKYRSNGPMLPLAISLCRCFLSSSYCIQLPVEKLSVLGCAAIYLAACYYGYRIDEKELLKNLDEIRFPELEHMSHHMLASTAQTIHVDTAYSILVARRFHLNEGAIPADWCLLLATLDKLPIAWVLPPNMIADICHRMKTTTQDIQVNVNDQIRQQTEFCYTVLDESSELDEIKVRLKITVI